MHLAHSANRWKARTYEIGRAPTSLPPDRGLRCGRWRGRAREPTPGVLAPVAAATPGCRQCAAHRRTCIVSVDLRSCTSNRDMWFKSLVFAKTDEVENDEEISHSRRRPKVVRIDRRARHIDPERSRIRGRIGIGDVLGRYLETERRANIISIFIIVKGQRLSSLLKKGDNYGRGKATWRSETWR